METKFYLYVKQHTKTGLKYFGMTTKQDPYKYLGSGQYWRRHLRTNGYEINTIELWEFDNIDDCEKFALDFSKKYNIVESTEWANLRPEHGRTGNPVGSPGMKKEKNPNWGKTKEQNSFYGKKHKAETIELYKKQKSGGNNPRAKKVKTPIGEFECANYAAKALKISRDTLRERLRNKFPGYNYI